jgi:DNA-binding response OmpR family regulator
MKASATVLIVDDNFLFRETLREIMCLIYPNWRILEASNGLEAIELVQTRAVDLVFLDFHMPFMNGYELALALQKKIDTDSVPLILMTSEDTEHPLIGRLRMLCQGVLCKPFSIKELERVLERVMSQLATPSFSPTVYPVQPILEAV